MEEESELEMECNVELHAVKEEQPNGSFPVKYYMKIQLPLDVYQDLLDRSDGQETCKVTLKMKKDSAWLKAEAYIKQGS